MGLLTENLKEKYKKLVSKEKKNLCSRAPAAGIAKSKDLQHIVRLYSLRRKLLKVLSPHSILITWI